MELEVVNKIGYRYQIITVPLLQGCGWCGGKESVEVELLNKGRQHLTIAISYLQGLGWGFFRDHPISKPKRMRAQSPVSLPTIMRAQNWMTCVRK